MPDFIENISKQAEQNPQNIAMSMGKEHLTYMQLFSNMRSVGYHAKTNGMVPGERIIFACKPNLQSLSLALGLVYAGMTVAIVDPQTSDELFKNRCNLVSPTYAVANPIVYHLGRWNKLFYKATGRQIANLANAVPNCFSFGVLGSGPNMKLWLDGVTGKNSYARHSEEQEAIIVFTSGTTSEPKGVVHTLGSLSANIEDFAQQMHIEQGTKVYAEPMTLGLVTMSKGGQWIIPADETCLPECDVWFATPADILKGLDIVKATTIPSTLKTVGIGAAPVLPSLVNEIDSVLGNDCRIMCVYGMTEILPIAIGDARKKSEYLTKGDFVGFPVGDTKVVENEDELFVEGSALTKGYLGRAAFDSLATGDFGEVLASGEIILKGRKKDMFIRGDMNVYPGLYEPGLATIEGVQQVAMVGIPDIYGDDQVILAATALPGVSTEELKKNLTKNMARFVDSDAIPSDVVILDNFPLSGRADKLDRLALTELVRTALK